MRSSSWTHRVDAYALATQNDTAAAGPLVRLACARHLRDRERASADPSWYQFRPERADHCIDFIEQCLRLPDMNDENGDAAFFKLSGWQAFIVGSLFGWVDPASGYRRFREGYIEAGKGCGKTPMAAAIGLYGLMMDGERAAEIYAAASDQEQATIMFRDAVRIAKASPEVDADLDYDGGEHIWQIRHPESMSTFRTFSRESGQKSGTRPHMGLMDELHEHPSPEPSTKIRAGAKRRPQPVFLEITNAGFDRTSICWQRHEHARKVVGQTVDDERFFSYVCTLDEGDDPLADEACWIKTNPNLGITPSVEYLRRQVENAKNIPAETNNVLRLNFCVWTQQQSRAINMEHWRACKPMPPDSELIGVPCFGCLDLGQTDDFTAWGRLWLLDDGRVAVKMRYWIPSVALERFPNRPYSEWQRAGLLTITEGEATDYEFVREAIKADCDAAGVVSVFYDPSSAAETAQILTGAGLDVVKTARGFGLNEAINRTLELVTTGNLCHGNERILSWMADNLVLHYGSKGERRIAKERAPDKIDGMAALIMGVEGAIVRRPREPEPKYDVVFLGRRL